MGYAAPASVLTRRMVQLAPVVVLLFAANARAEAPEANEQLPKKPLAEEVQLEYILWPGTDSCPRERPLRHAILSTMMKKEEVDPFSPTAKAKLRVVIRRVGPYFEGSYDIIDSDGNVVWVRTLTIQEDCGLVVADLAFSVGRFLPLFITAPIPKKPAPVCSPAPAPSCPPAKAPPPALPVKPARAFDIWFGGGPLFSYFISPLSAAFGFSASIGAQWPRLSVSLGGRIESTTKNGPAAGPVTARRIAGEVVPCYRFPPESPVFACGVLQVGVLNIEYLSSDGFRSDNWPNAILGARFGTLRPFGASGWGGYLFGQFDVPIGLSHFHEPKGAYDLHETVGVTGMAGLIYLWEKK